LVSGTFIKELQMSKLKVLMFFSMVLIFTSCFSSPPKNDTSDIVVYFYKNPTTEYLELESIGYNRNSNYVMYSIDRDEALIMMEIGTYTIKDGIITINAGKFQAVGIITDEKIVIDDKEFFR